MPCDIQQSVASFSCNFSIDLATGDQGIDGDILKGKTDSYKKWLEERKKLRGVLNGCGLNQDWLAKKNGRTELESRVLRRLRKESRLEKSGRKVEILGCSF